MATFYEVRGRTQIKKKKERKMQTGQKNDRMKKLKILTLILSGTIFITVAYSIINNVSKNK